MCVGSIFPLHKSTGLRRATAHQNDDADKVGSPNCVHSVDLICAASHLRVDLREPRGNHRKAFKKNGTAHAKEYNFHPSNPLQFLVQHTFGARDVSRRLAKRIRLPRISSIRPVIRDQSQLSTASTLFHNSDHLIFTNPQRICVVERAIKNPLAGADNRGMPLRKTAALCIGHPPNSRQINIVAELAMSEGLVGDAGDEPYHRTRARPVPHSSPRTSTRTALDRRQRCAARDWTLGSIQKGTRWGSYPGLTKGFSDCEEMDGWTGPAGRSGQFDEDEKWEGRECPGCIKEWFGLTAKELQGHELEEGTVGGGVSDCSASNSPEKFGAVRGTVQCISELDSDISWGDV
ncbi:hypothetical protein B0H17DRAFT_1137276 [Mycena rosella]|uniref:Uncharacterized protein n=1 Tax=Mycena rosella TaxID=1033263 RepID=A0AAD7D969_MYCRO|nr:hypothetical protein B0H17DRAFT_1137276 [Mycena rosella]